MLCLGASPEVLDGESTHLGSVVVWAKEAIGQKEEEKEGLQGKKEGVPKDSFMVRFGAIRLATLNSGVQCAQQLLAPWLRDALPYLGSKEQSTRQPFLVPKVRFYAASLLPNTRVAITTTRATAMPPISEGQGEPVKPATRYPNKQMTATREA